MQNNGVSQRVESQQFVTLHDYNPRLSSMSYFGVTKEFSKLNYAKFIVCVFKCKWVDKNISVWTDDFGITLVDLKKLAYQNDPFIIAEQAK